MVLTGHQRLKEEEMRTEKIVACFGAIFSLIIFAHVAKAAPADPGFYKGKVINYIVATKPGGGYDAYARVIGKYMQKHLPGSTVVIKNIPGAGHIIGAN